MSKILAWLVREYVSIVCAALLLICMLLFAVVAMLLRPLVIIGGLMALLATMLCFHLSATIRKWLGASVGQSIEHIEYIEYMGLNVATDVYLSSDHSWARAVGEDAVVGVDDLLQATLGTAESVDLPGRCAHVDQGDALFSLRRGDRRIAIRAPVAGTITSWNESLRQHPELVNLDPFNLGWAVRIRADEKRSLPRQLLKGGSALVWFRQEVDRLIRRVFGSEGDATAPRERREFLGELRRRIDDEAWSRLSADFFAGRRSA